MTTGRSTRTIRPSQCTICCDPNRAQIELEVVSGASLRGLAKKYNTSKDALARHVGNHV